MMDKTNLINKLTLKLDKKINEDVIVEKELKKSQLENKRLQKQNQKFVKKAADAD